MDDFGDRDWDPMREEYENPNINCYEFGPGVNIDVNYQRPAYRSRDDKPVYKLYVSRIPFRMTKTGLTNLFLNFGQPTEVALHRSNDGRGQFAFVSFRTLNEAHNALRCIDRAPPFHIHVTFAKSDASRQKLEQQKKVEEEARKAVAESCPVPDQWCKDMLQGPSINPLHGVGRNLRIGLGKLLIKAFPSSNSRTCEWTEEDSDIANSQSLLPDINKFSASNKVLQGLVIVSTTDNMRKVSMGRGYVPPYNPTGENIVPKPFIMESQGVFRQGEDVVVPARKCSACNSFTVMKCCQCGEPYCSKECQKGDFPTHKSKCSPKVSIDVTVDREGEQRSVKLGTLCQRMDTSDHVAHSSNRSAVVWNHVEKHTLDCLTQGQSVLFRVVCKDYPFCIGILSCKEIFEETSRLVVEMPDYFKDVKHDNSFRPAEGALVCVYYGETYWRAYVLAASSYGTNRPYQVALCDQGKIVEVPFQNIYRLPLKYHDLPELSVKCTVLESYLPGDIPELWNYITEEEDYFMQVEDTDFTVVMNLLKDDKPVGKLQVSRWEPILKQRNVTVATLDPPCRVFMSAYHDQHAVFVRRIGKSFQEEFFKILQGVAAVHVTAPPLGRSPRKGEMVACQFERDRNFYRAVVCDLNAKEEYKVFFVDFGNVEWVKADHMKALPEDLKMLPFMAVKVSLRGVPSEPLTEDSIIFLNSLVQREQELQLECAQDPHQGGVELFIPGHKTSLNAQLSQLLMPLWKQAVSDGKEPYDGSKTGRARILVLNILPHGRLSVCPVDRPEIEHVAKTLSHQINEFCESFDDRHTYCPRDQEVCLAKYNDGLWYRAVCMRSTSSHSCEVMFLDYGNIDEVDFHDVRRMVPDFTHTPCLVSICSIDGLPENPTTDMTKRVSELISLQEIYEVRVLKMNEEGDYKIHIPEISNQLISEQS